MRVIDIIQTILALEIMFTHNLVTFGRIDLNWNQAKKMANVILNGENYENRRDQSRD